MRCQGISNLSDGGAEFSQITQAQFPENDKHCELWCEVSDDERPSGARNRGNPRYYRRRIPIKLQGTPFIQNVCQSLYPTLQLSSPVRVNNVIRREKKQGDFTAKYKTCNSKRRRRVFFQSWFSLLFFCVTKQCLTVMFAVSKHREGHVQLSSARRRRCRTTMCRRTSLKLLQVQVSH